MIRSSLLYTHYAPLVIVLVVAAALSAVILLLSYVLGLQAPDAQKLTAYECGFDAFGDARSRFDVRFYLVAILFVIFDLEATYLFPWSITLGEAGALSFWSRRDFVVELLVGYIYAWKRGALEWA